MTIKKVSCHPPDEPQKHRGHRKEFNNEAESVPLGCDSAHIVKLKASTFCRDLTAPRLRGNVPANTDVCAHTSGAGRDKRISDSLRFSPLTIFMNHRNTFG